MTAREIRALCPLAEKPKKLLRQAVETLGLSARVHDRLLRVARTIADLADAAEIAELHVAEALQYRLPHPRDGRG